ncbi:uncharacterized protein LOC112452670, partial [Temnothorax curvispinosus]|uniref:Uncharacterized protein LOC112452670 n=1 Tax=Temnothorax curvispinosus TaxID=300111 RepID=A0A6J1PGS5_9HYME
MITPVKNGKRLPVSQKCVILDSDRKLQFYVYGRDVDSQKANLDETLEGIETLPNVLNKFKEMNVCSGVGEVNIDLLRADTVFQDGIQQWRSKDCSLLFKKRRCDSCMKMRKRIQGLITRNKNRKKNGIFLRNIGASNSIERRNLVALRLKCRRQKCQQNRAKEREKHLMSCLKKQEEQIANMQEATLDEKCSALNVPAAQQLALKEIVAAASKKDTKSRRYREDWMMLCMLMNIRSPGYYQFLRKNNILPLLCLKSVRRYLSLIDMKCGFDERFAELLKKHLATKTLLQRHGVLLLDEINLRKSVAVCSKNLTYVGLTDLGDNGLRSSDISEQATHGLVVMFQSLADTYTQPIAVFASKNPVKGEELAKLIVKGIIYLEKCGATIHGVIADGAATNQKMWSLLDVRSTMQNTKTWFTHPSDDERKVFVFSDTPHVIKNIRNRLLNQKKLRLNSTENYICWQYFETLYELDKSHPGNAHACPKITERHVHMDNASKIRLATQ